MYKMVLHWSEILILFGLSIHNGMAQCTTETRPLTLNVTAFPLILTSTNYPNNYPPDQHCSWLLTTGDMYSRIIINLMDVQTDSLVDCDLNDHLVIYDDSTINAKRIVGAQLCEGNADDLVNAFVSSSDSLYVEFFSNSVDEARGFRMLAFKNDSDYQPNCGETYLQADPSVRVLMSPYLPDRYDNDVMCMYNITTSSPDAVLRVDVYFGDYESSDGCNEDFIVFIEQVYQASITEDIAATLAHNLQELVLYAKVRIQVTDGPFLYCNTSRDNEFVSFLYNSSSVVIRLVTDSNNTFYGFMLTYVEYMTGVNLLYPSDGQTITLSVPENLNGGFIDMTTAYIEAFGSNSLTIMPNNTNSPFGLAHPGGIKYYLFINSTLDYESVSIYFLEFHLIDSIDELDVRFVFFEINIEDVDEFAPVIHNLPVTIDIPLTSAVGDAIFSVYANDSDGSLTYSNVVYELSVNLENQFNIDPISGYVSLAVDPQSSSFTVSSGVITVTAYSYNTSSLLFTSGNISFSFSGNTSSSVSPDTSTSTVTPRVPFSCLPNPRRVDVRMDADVGSVLLTDLNCTSLTGVSYNIVHQHPSNTFLFTYQVNGPYSLILNAPVYKIKFYTLRMNISDGIDSVMINFKVNVQTEQCSPEDVSNGNARKSGEIHKHIVTLFIVLYKLIEHVLN